MAEFKELADAVTQGALALLTVAAALVVVLGIVSAVRTRRREQVVIDDIGELDLPDGTAKAASLSPWLRQRVRAALARQRLDADHLVKVVLQHDVALHRVPVRMDFDDAVSAISSAADDALATLTRGLNALVPEQAGGFVGAVQALLPRRRGFRILIRPLWRGHPDAPRLGLSVEVALLDGPPVATTTFWEHDGVALGEGNPQERLVALIEPTAWWIALRLLTNRLVIRRRGYQRPVPASVRLGLRQLFAGGLARTAMEDFREYAEPFGEDASDELERAIVCLADYHRPSETLAGVQEELGRVRQRAGRVDDARKNFARALAGWRRAEADMGRYRQEAQEDVERLRVRRLKAQLLHDGPGVRAEVERDLSDRPLARAGNLYTLYNAACLYAALGGDHLGTAADLIGRALLVAPDRNVRAYAVRDEELAPVPDLAAYLDHLATLRPNGGGPLTGDEAGALTAAAWQHVRLRQPTA